MTQPEKPAPRRFDDVARLFGDIVPPAGTPVRPTPPLRPSKPPHLSVQAAQSINEQPPTAVDVQAAAPTTAVPAPPVLRPAQAPRPQIVADPVRSDAPSIIEPKGPPALKTGSREVPWPDAFAPRPNFRRPPAARTWTLALLVPLGAVVASAIFLVDPRAAREFVDRRIVAEIPRWRAAITAWLPASLHPAAEGRPSSTTSAPTPAPPSPAADEPRPAAPAPTMEAPASPPAETAAPPSSAQKPASEEPAVAPVATPSSDQTGPTAGPAPQGSEPSGAAAGQPSLSVPPESAAPAAPTAVVVPSVVPSVPPPAAPPTAEIVPAPIQTSPTEPATHPASPPIDHVIVYYRRGPASAETEAKRVAAIVGPSAASIELRAVSTTLHAPVVAYARAAEREAAGAIAHALAGSEGGWIIRQGTPGRTPGVEIWLP